MGHRVSRGVPACLALLLVSLFAGACGEDAPTEAYEVSGYVTELGSGEDVKLFVNMFDWYAPFQ